MQESAEINRFFDHYDLGMLFRKLYSHLILIMNFRIIIKMQQLIEAAFAETC